MTIYNRENAWAALPQLEKRIEELEKKLTEKTTFVTRNVFAKDIGIAANSTSNDTTIEIDINKYVPFAIRGYGIFNSADDGANCSFINAYYLYIYRQDGKWYLRYRLRNLAASAAKVDLYVYLSCVRS